MNSSVTRTELFAFWYWIDANASLSSHCQKAGVAQRRLLLLARLAPDEVLDIGVVDVEHDHLHAPRLATRLDRPGPRVGAAHERHRRA